MNTISYADHLLRERDLVSKGLRLDEGTRATTLACLVTFLTLSTFYGAVMGAQGLFHGRPEGWMFVLASAIKLPLLFSLTLAICLPLLYVLNVLIGPRARFSVVLALIMSSIAVTSIVLASCAPIVGFFMLSTDSHAFIKILNVFVFGVAGIYGVWYLGQGLSVLSPPPVQVEDKAAPAGNGTSAIKTWWLVTYGLVGTQMAWLMRPFIGDPNMPFSIFRQQESNFYIHMMETLGKFLFG